MKNNLGNFGVNQNAQNAHSHDHHDHASLKHAMLAGFVASAVSSLALIILTSVILIPEFDFISIQGSIFGLAGTAVSAWAVYFIIGTFIWGPLYSMLEPKIAKNTLNRGLLFGLLVWLIVMAILMPLAGEGFFLMHKYSMSAAAIVLVVDLIFGLTTAYFYNKLYQ